MVWWMSFSVWAALRNAASNCDGGRYTPLSSMARKKRAKALVSHLAAEVQLVTGPSVKNQVNIDPTRLQQSGTPASRAAAGNSFGQLCTQHFQAGIEGALVAAQVAQSGEACCHGQRIPGKRAGLIHRAQGRHHVHDVGRPAVRAHRQPAADDLSEGGQVGKNSVALLRAAERQPKAGHHFVKNEQRLVAQRDLAQGVQIEGRGRDASHVAHHRLHDHAGDLVAELS